MAHPNLTPRLDHTEEALTVLFCLIDDAYRLLNPRGARRYESIKRLADSEVMTLALFQQLRSVESERSFLRDAERFCSHLFPGVVGGCTLPLVTSASEKAQALPGAPAPQRPLRDGRGPRETVLVDSTLLSVLHPGQVSQGSGFSAAAWVRWGSFSVYGVKLHLICATNGIPLSYELTSAANVADGSLAEELLTEAALGDGVARRLLGDLAYNSKELKKALGEVGILLATERSEKRAGVRQRVEIALSSLKRVFGLGETLASTLVGLATRIAAKICAYTYADRKSTRL